MLKKLFLVMLITINLNASQKEFFESINTIYADDFYNKISNYTSLPLNSYENNTTQKKIKEDFEKNLPIYLSNKNLFTKSSLERLEKDEVKKYKIWMFVSISLSYIKYLEAKNNHQLSKEIMERNLINLHDLMINSNGMIDYVLALATYSKLFSNYNNPSLEMVSILKRYPPPNKSIYLQKIEADKMRMFKMIDEMDNVGEENMADYATSDYKKLMSKVRSCAKSQLGRYFSKYTIATTSESKLEIEKYNKYIKAQSNSLLSIWSKIKLLIHTILAKILHIFIGYNSQYDYMAEYIGEILAVTAVPQARNIYSDHIKMTQEYKDLLKLDSKLSL